MENAILSRDVSLVFQGYEVKAKAGTRLEFVKGASGTLGNLWAIPPSQCDAGKAGRAGTWSIFGHDSKHHYIFAPPDAVTLAD